MTYFIETYGCQMNKAESLALEQVLNARGWTLADDAKLADLILINTCSVRITAETRVWGRLSYYASIKRNRKKANLPRLTIAVTGCMAERLKKDLKKKQPGVDHIIGTYQKSAFNLMLDACEQGKKIAVLEETPYFVFADNHYENGASRSFVPIMHGCNNFCTYCIVPYLRGREISRNPQEILNEIQMLSDKGVREITLLGQNVNSYSYVYNTAELTFTELLRLITNFIRSLEKTNIRWIRFLSSHPKDFSDELITFMRDEKLIERHIHLCVQHGSTSVLNRMNRKYTREQYLALVKKIKDTMPDVSLSTDILVGFPQETEEEFQETLSLMNEVKFENAFLYHFNPREGTKAFTMEGHINEDVKLKRLALAIDLQNAITREIMEKRIGSVVDVLVENVSRRDKNEVLARTQQDEMVVFKGNPEMIGSFYSVKLLSLNGNTFKALVIE